MNEDLAPAMYLCNSLTHYFFPLVPLNTSYVVGSNQWQNIIWKVPIFDTPHIQKYSYIKYAKYFEKEDMQISKLQS